MSETMVKKKSSSKKSNISNDKVLEMLYEKVGKPNNALLVSCYNVFDSSYRVNVWHSLNHPFLNNAGYISASYFFSIENDVIIIK